MSSKKRYALKIISILILGITFSFVLTISLGSNANQRHIDANYYALGAESPVFYMGEDGYYTFTKPAERDFRILQLTDLHIGGGIFSVKKDSLALDCVFNLIEAAEPDLIIITGDILYPFFPQSGNINNMKTARQFASFMEKIRIPWTLVFGNHDMEAYSFSSNRQLARYFSSADLKYCLLSNNPEDVEVFGYGNHIINIRNEDNTLNTSLVMLDSNRYVQCNMFKYDIIRDSQVEWYRESILSLSTEANGIAEGEVVSSLAFFHIPLNEYQTAWDLYQQGSTEVEYLYGVMDEKILAPTVGAKLPRGKFFEEMVALGSTKATFCGHNHKNNFAIIYNGIQLSFSNTVVYLGLFGIDKTDDYRGGTLISIAEDRAFTSELIYLRDVS